MGDIESYEDIERTLVAFRHVVSGLALDDAKSARNLFLIAKSSRCADDTQGDSITTVWRQEPWRWRQEWTPTAVHSVGGGGDWPLNSA